MMTFLLGSTIVVVTAEEAKQDIIFAELISVFIEISIILFF